MKKLKLKKKTDVRSTDSAAGSPEGGRRPTVGDPAAGGQQNLFAAPNPEVLEKRPRRRFTAKYKLDILKQADTCIMPGQIGALLRREGLYSSNLTTWRKQYKKGILNAMAPKKRGRKIKKKNPLAIQVAQLEKEKRKLIEKLRKAEIIIDVQKKISQILEINQDQDEKNE